MEARTALNYLDLVGWASEDGTLCGRYGLSTRPEYYSGRGVNRGDLNERHLQRIHAGLQRYHGDEAAAAFVRLVKSLSDLSATNFLNQLKAFCSRGGEWGETPAGRESGIDVGPDEPGREAVAFGTFAGMLGRDTSPEWTRLQTEEIRDAFLMLIGEPVSFAAHAGARYKYGRPPRW